MVKVHRYDHNLWEFFSLKYDEYYHWYYILVLLIFLLRKFSVEIF